MIKGLMYGFVGTWSVYFYFMFILNVMCWLGTNESEMYYQPVWNIFTLS